MSFVMTMARSPNLRRRIRPTRVRAGHPLRVVRWSHWPKATYVYIRNEGDGREQLFREPVDPDERENLAKVEAMRPDFDQLRRRLNHMRANPPRAAR